MLKRGRVVVDQVFKGLWCGFNALLRTCLIDLYLGEKSPELSSFVLAYIRVSQTASMVDYPSLAHARNSSTILSNKFGFSQ